MSNPERITNTLKIRSAIEEYKGFTQGEKTFALNNLNDWKNHDGCCLDKFREDFEKMSLDIQPFLEDSDLI